MKVNNVVLGGYLTRDPVLKEITGSNGNNDVKVCNFSIAVEDKFATDGVSFFPIVTYSKTAENCNKYLSKGKPVLVEGKMLQKRWDAADGTKRTNIECIAHSVQFLGK